MNELSENMLDALIPQCAIIAYGCEPKERIDYIEFRKITAGQMGAGVPLTHKAISDLIKTLKVDDTASIPHGKIPPNMLYCDTRPGNERYIWYNPPRKRFMFFTKNLNIEDREYNVPGVIYKVFGRELSIYSYKGKNLNEDSKLFEAPFFNITDASVCIGNSSSNVTKPDNLTFEKLTEYWETIFWQSEFSHLGGNRINGNLVLETKKAAVKPFNEKVLVPYKSRGKQLMLKDLIK